MSRLALLAVLLAVPAVAQAPAPGGYRRYMDSYVGAKPHDLLRDWGMPSQMMALGHHDLVFIYRERSWVGTRCVSQFELKEGRVVSWRFQGDCEGDFSGEDLTPTRSDAPSAAPPAGPPPASSAPAPWLGVDLAEVDAAVAQRLSLGAPRGVLIICVKPKSPALAAGLATLDVVTAVDVTPVNDVASLQSAIAARRAGDSARISVVRNGKVEQLRVTLAARPAG